LYTISQTIPKEPNVGDISRMLIVVMGASHVINGS
ncbi:Os06g0100700, partial [Oryza sativa Japonica Group]